MAAQPGQSGGCEDLSPVVLQARKGLKTGHETRGKSLTGTLNASKKWRGFAKSGRVRGAQAEEGFAGGAEDTDAESERA